MSYILTGAAAYLVLACITIAVNVYVRRDSERGHPKIIIRNAALWPVFLPMLIWREIKSRMPK